MRLWLRLGLWLSTLPLLLALLLDALLLALLPGAFLLGPCTATGLSLGRRSLRAVVRFRSFSTVVPMSASAATFAAGASASASAASASTTASASATATTTITGGLWRCAHRYRIQPQLCLLLLTLSCGPRRDRPRPSRRGAARVVRCGPDPTELELDSN